MAKKKLVDELDILRDARRYVNRWAEQKGGYISPHDFSEIHLQHNEDVIKYNIANPDKKKMARPIMKCLLESALDVYIKQQPEKQKAAIRAKIACVTPNLEPLKQWVKAVTGQVKEDDLYVMAHWVWLVKRNCLELPVVHHIMPIVTSKDQGGGKSTAVRNLYGPIEELALELKMPQAVDERSFTMFTNHLVGFFDEMAGAEKVEIADFKRNVTSSTLTYRPMRTNAQVKIHNRCTFIGASNNSIFDIIKDTTGIRRFFPIDALTMLDQPTIKNMDYLSLWQGVDEKEPRGYFELVKEQIASKQAQLQMKDEVVLFVEENHILPIPDKPLVEVNGKMLYNEYRLHAANSGIRYPVGSQVFYKKLRALGLTDKKKRDSNRSDAFFFMINSDTAIPLEDKR